MIPEITFKEFINTLFEYTKTPLKERDWITAHKNILYNNDSYAYTWGEIEDYINRWLIKIPISKLDDEVRTAYDIMDKIVNDWYLLNFDHKGGRVICDENSKHLLIYDIEEFELHTKIREFIYLKAEKIKKEAGAKQYWNVAFEGYLINVGIRSSEFTYEDDVLFQNVKYFKKCWKQQLPPYKALLFLSDQINKKDA